MLASGMSTVATKHRQRVRNFRFSRKTRAVSSSKWSIYLDYAATTPVAPEVASEMARYLTIDGVFGNPSSISHGFGNDALEAVEAARKEVADLIGARPGEIVFTSGATEAINLAIRGVMLSPCAKKRVLAVSALEHKAVLDTAKSLAEAGIRVLIMAPNTQGLITPEVIATGLLDETALVSVMLVNNETGTLTDIAGISRVVHEAGALLHVDATQAAARLPFQVQTLGADLISLSGHKIYGPKGVGALYIRRAIQPDLVPHTYGGGQEGGLRPGTLATHQIVGLGKAAEMVKTCLGFEMRQIEKLDMQLLRQLEDIDGCTQNGNRRNRVPGILNMAFSGVSAESLMLAMPDVAVSTGSACTSKSVEPSHVLTAIGLDEELSLSSIRFSIGRYTTAPEIDYVADKVRRSVSALRGILP